MRRRLTPRRVVNLTLAVLLIALAVWRFLPRDDSFTAEFENASGIAVDDEVRVAGLPAGTVHSVELHRGVVTVGFEVTPDVAMTTDTHAAVKLATVLGQHYLEIEPGAGEALPAGATIPLSQTDSAYTLDRFTTDANDDIQAIDAGALGRAVDVLTRSLDGDPRATDQALAGITRVSRMVSDRQEQIHQLVSSARQVTDVVHTQQGTLMSLLTDADKLAALVVERRRTIELMLENSRSVVHQVTLFVRANQHQLDPTLTRLQRMVRTLAQQRDQLDQILAGLPAQSRYFANATGNGPWIEVYAPAFLLSDNLLCPIISPQDCS